MPDTSKEYRSFSGGLVTEATPISAPDNAAKSMDNMDLNRDGSISRRLGLGYEPAHRFISTGYNIVQYNAQAKSTFLWKSASERSDIEIMVVQVGNHLHFLDATAVSVSLTHLNGGVPLVLTGSSTDVTFDFTTVSGVLVVTTGDQFCRYIRYDQSTGVFTEEKYSLLVRDIWGLQDNLAIDERATSLSRLHEYNLKNQGWSESRTKESFTRTSKYPSNADIVTFGIDETNNKVFEAFLVTREDFGTTPAPKGRIIIDLLERSATRAAGALKTDNSNDVDSPNQTTQTPLTNWDNSIKWGDGISGVISLLTGVPVFSGVPTDRTTGGITVAAAYAGRIFYSGFSNALVGGDTKSPLLGDYVAFSQVVDNPSVLGLCHASADPTASSDNQLVASDGGTIKITGAGRVHRMLPMGRSLIVLAENGVWSIAGGGDSVFAADQFEVNYISNIGTSHPDSILDAEGSIIYWADSGIYQVSFSAETLNITATPLTETTIKTLYEGISTSSRDSAIGSYDSVSKKIAWIYSSEYPYDVRDKEVALDGVLGAWYTSTFPSITNFPELRGVVTLSNYQLNSEENLVLYNDEQVVYGSNDVVHTDTVRSSGALGTKYLVSSIIGGIVSFTFGLKNNATFRDWEEFDLVGVDSPAHYQSWEDILDDTQRRKQAKYITFNLKRTETGAVGDTIGVDVTNPSSCLVTGYWDYAIAPSGKITSQFEAYRLHRPYIPEGSGDPFNYGHTVVTTRNKLRGRGRALSIRVDTSPDKDLVLYSWAINYYGGSGV